MRSRSVVWQLMLLTIVLGAGAILAGCASAPPTPAPIAPVATQVAADLDDVPPAATTDTGPPESTPTLAPTLPPTSTPTLSISM